MADGIVLGFYGKVPSHGDFVRRRVGAAFLNTWDGWLQRTLRASREAFGEQWLQIYLTSPIWRFALSPAVCGERSHAGVLMPSVDSVGRYFPLTVVAELPDGVRPLNLAVEHSGWFRRLEALALSVLSDEEPFDLAGFDRAVEALGAELCPRVAQRPVPAVGREPACFGLDGLEDMATSLVALAGAHVEAQQGGHSVWWSEGSERVGPCWFTSPALPEAELFVAALDGQWQAHGWRACRLQWTMPDAGYESPALPGRAPRLASSGRTHPGHVRAHNEDAFVELGDRGIWAVADGVGGQEGGANASRMVVDALRQLAGGGDLQSRVNELRDRLEAVNRHLRHLSERPVAPENGASTVAALLVGEGGCAFVWAGDSRIYRLRDGELTRCTRDHSLVEGLIQQGTLAREDAADHPQSNVITRAIGGADTVEFEMGFGDLLSGDRYLLCSDGVHGVITEAELCSVLVSERNTDTACRRVVDLVLSRDAPDNLTALIVDASDPDDPRGTG